MKKVFLFAAALAVVLAGCSQDDSVPGSDTRTAALGISSVSMSAAVTTKADVTLTTSGSSIGVYRTADAGNGYAAQLSQYTYTTSWASASPVYLNNNNAQICAYYPYAYTATPLAVALTAQKDDALQDLVYAKNAAYSNTNKTANLTMGHAYSKITFTITKDATYTGTGAISSLSLSNAALVQSNTIDITSGTYGSGTVATVTYNPAIASITTSATTALLLPPTVTAMSGNVSLSIIVDGSTLTTTIPASSFPSSKLVAGSNYTVALIIKGSALIVGSVAITDWADTATTGGPWYPSI
ncbi:MAG: hypothetical protein H6Q12_213 [Bacteroidetes bacterium]|nr:hypothetical protein [Bacteroidota bacterium]